MHATRPIYVITLFLFAGLLLTASPVRAETALIDILKATPEWFGTVNQRNQLAVTFHVVGDPPALESVSYRWKQNRERDAVEFKLGNADIEFMIPPEKRNRWYKLTLTKGGTLQGSLTGNTRDGSGTFEEYVFLRPVDATKGTVTELKGSAKLCIVPPDFAVSDGQGLALELKGFLGFFSGTWGDYGQLSHTLWVTNITSDGNAVAYYAIEAYEPWNINNPSCSRHKGTIKDKVLTLNFRNGAIVKYRLMDADTLQGTYDRRNRITAGQFKRHN